jgi:cellulose synthase/poly-beta-1,6-N-acetylglucosamine synthase-like glycosyltransferase
MDATPPTVLVNYRVLVPLLYAFIIYYRYVFGLFELACYCIYPTIRETPNSVPEKSKTSPTVSIVCATINDEAKLKNALATWLLGEPHEVWIVTDDSSFEAVKANISTAQGRAINLIRCSRRNKRAQLCEGFKRCTGDIIIVADDDIYWSPIVVGRLTEPFKRDPALGAAFPEVKFRPAGQQFNLWETLSASRLAGDCIDIRTTMAVDGGVFCASGTTAAYHATLLKDPKFLSWFPNETWMGRQLNAGDDQSLTLWLCKHGWKCQVIPDEGISGFCVLTTPRADWKHFGQLIRWSRSDWQACLRSSFMTTSVWRYVVYFMLPTSTYSWQAETIRSQHIPG